MKMLVFLYMLLFFLKKMTPYKNEYAFVFVLYVYTTAIWVGKAGNEWKNDATS